MSTNAKAVSILEIEDANLTPGMRQYRDAKKENPDCLLLMRMGDFYEIFYEDAVIAARDLEITLTSRGKGTKAAPLAGIPFHALENYLGKLVRKGHKVAIVEQLEDPKQAKGLVKRGLVRIVTPGTLMESSLLQSSSNNYLGSIFIKGTQHAYAICDISTGEFSCSEFNSHAGLLTQLDKMQIAELLVPQSLLVNQELLDQLKALETHLSISEDRNFAFERSTEALCKQLGVQSLSAFGLEEDNAAQVQAAGALLEYIARTQRQSLNHINTITVERHSNTMRLSRSTLRHLELFETAYDRKHAASLLWILDATSTAMGARLLKKIVKEPLLDPLQINARLDAIEELNLQTIAREELRNALKSIYDLERLLARVNYGTANPRDLLSLKNSLQVLPTLSAQLKGSSSDLLVSIRSMKQFAELAELLSKALKEDAPLSVREGGVIAKGHNAQLDELNDIRFNAKQYLQEIESKERLATGIASLKVSYNRVFGYFIEVSRKQSAKVPSHYIRKQTMANAERYITDELKEIENKILGAQEKIISLEYRLFQELLEKIAVETVGLQQTAKAIALLDVLCNLSEIAMQNGYVRPKFTDDGSLTITAGRHPVLEQLEERFISNDIMLKDGEMMIITGPNTSGKSTIMRQTALICLMAQMGSFVPADTATLSIIDQIFTRVGAHDNLSSGQSTFMVEMLETAQILNTATSQSLLILDEIGRGTSTFDGVAIAWSCAEYIYNNISAKTLFATHYHVLNKLADQFERIENYNVAVKEQDGQIIFLRRLVKGGTDQSHGIHVAQMAGMPDLVVERARQIQGKLRSEDQMTQKIKGKIAKKQSNLTDFKN